MGPIRVLSSWRRRPGASVSPEANGFFFLADGLAGLLLGACLFTAALGLSLQAVRLHDQARQRQLAAMVCRQVMEGFHGVPFDAPLGRTREVVEICRKVWRRENLDYDGKYYQLPLPADRGTGLGKSLHLINHPVRDRIPITIAALQEAVGHAPKD